MATTPQEWAKLFGARVVGEAPDVDAGPLGMARLAYFLHKRLTPSQGQRPGRPTDQSWKLRPKIPMSDATRKKLKKLAAKASSPGRRVSAMQLAAHLLEDAVTKLAE